MKKPKLNEVVYTIYRDSITKTTVAYIGNDSFITEHFNRGYDYGYEFYYKDCNITWFTDFDKAKNKILENEDSDDVELKQFADDYWEIVFNEE